MKSPKMLLFMAALAAFAALYLWNALNNPTSPDFEGSASTSGSTGKKDGREQETFIEVETPSGIERLRAERITFVLLNTGKLAYDAKLSVSGYLFGQGEEVAITLHDAAGRQEAEIGTAWTDKEGTLLWYAFDVPKDIMPGKHIVKVEGRSSGKIAETSFSLRAGNPWINPSTYSGKPQTIVDLEGGGYFADEMVSVYLDSVGGDPLEIIPADVQGSLAVSVRVPMTNEGDHALIIVGERTNSPVRIPFSVLGFQPWGALSNYSPQPNQAVGFSGHDFVPGEEIRIYLNQFGTEVAATAQADEEGNFEIAETFLPPGDAVGENTFLFVGTVSQRMIEVPFEVLPLTPSLELSTYAGLPGATISFKGQGFVPTETLRAYIGKPEPGKEISVFAAGEDGAFEDAGTFRVPFEGTGSSVAITLVGDRSRSPTSLVFAVLPYGPWANLSAYFGPPGTEIVIDGGGFAPGEAVTVRFENRQAPPVLTVQADPEGAFQRAGPVAVLSFGNENTSVVLVGEKSGAEVIASFAIRSLDEPPENVPPPPAHEAPSPAPTEAPVETQPPSARGPTRAPIATSASMTINHIVSELHTTTITARKRLLLFKEQYDAANT